MKSGTSHILQNIMIRFKRIPSGGIAFPIFKHHSVIVGIVAGKAALVGEWSSGDFESGSVVGWVECC